MLGSVVLMTLAMSSLVSWVQAPPPAPVTNQVTPPSIKVEMPPVKVEMPVSGEGPWKFLETLVGPVLGALIAWLTTWFSEKRKTREEDLATKRKCMSAY